MLNTTVYIFQGIYIQLAHFLSCLLFLSFNFLYMFGCFACMCVCACGSQCPWRVLRLELQSVVSTMWVWWEPNLDPLEELSVFLTSEPYLQPQNCFVLFFFLSWFKYLTPCCMIFTCQIDFFSFWDWTAVYFLAVLFFPFLFPDRPYIGSYLHLYSSHCTLVGSWWPH